VAEAGIYPCLVDEGAAWTALDKYRMVPALWNAFPFHPHETGNQQSNRKPTKSEISLGQPFLYASIDFVKNFRYLLTITKPRLTYRLVFNSTQSN